MESHHLLTHMHEPSMSTPLLCQGSKATRNAYLLSCHHCQNITAASSHRPLLMGGPVASARQTHCGQEHARQAAAVLRWVRHWDNDSRPRQPVFRGDALNRCSLQLLCSRHRHSFCSCCPCTDLLEVSAVLARLMVLAHQLAQTCTEQASQQAGP